jgi:hypothetical protein
VLQQDVRWSSKILDNVSPQTMTHNLAIVLDLDVQSRHLGHRAEARTRDWKEEKRGLRKQAS